MASDKTDILIFVEDPGAANIVVDLPTTLAGRGLAALTVAAGHALSYLGSLEGSFVAAAPSETAASLIDAHAPRLILAGTSENRDTLGLRLIEEARRRGIPSVSVVDMPTSAEYRFRGRGKTPLAFAPDWLLVPDDITLRRFVDLGMAVDRVVDCGHPYFDRMRDAGRALATQGRAAVRARALPDAPSDRPVLVFLAEISDGLVPGAFERGDDYTLSGRGGSNLRTRIVLEEVLDAIALLQPRPYVVLRLHPKNTEREFAAYRRDIDHLSQGGLPHEIMFAADLVVGMTTASLFEAALMGCPTLSVIPRPVERKWQIGIALGIISCVHTREALRETLAGAVADPTRLIGMPADKVIRFGALDRMADFLEGRLAAGARRSKAGGED